MWKVTVVEIRRRGVGKISVKKVGKLGLKVEGCSKFKACCDLQ